MKTFLTNFEFGFLNLTNISMPRMTIDIDYGIPSSDAVVRIYADIDDLAAADVCKCGNQQSDCQCNQQSVLEIFAQHIAPKGTLEALVLQPSAYQIVTKRRRMVLANHKKPV